MPDGCRSDAGQLGERGTPGQVGTPLWRAEGGIPLAEVPDQRPAMLEIETATVQRIFTRNAGKTFPDLPPTVGNEVHGGGKG